MKRFASRIVAGTIASLCLIVGNASAAIEGECSGPVSTNVRFGIAGTQLWLTLADRAADGFLAGGDKLSAASAELSHIARMLRETNTSDAGVAANRFAGRDSAASIMPGENGDLSYSVLTDDGGLIQFGQGGNSLGGGSFGGISGASSAGSLVSQASGGLLSSIVVSPTSHHVGELDHDLQNHVPPTGGFAPYIPGAPLAIVAPAYPNETRHGMASSPPSPAGSALDPTFGAVHELPEPSAILVWGALALGGAWVYRYRGAARCR